MQFIDRARTALAGLGRREWLLVAVAALGFVARIWLWHASEGTNDIRTWQRFGFSGQLLGLGDTYVQLPGFNHPPLMGWWGIWALRLSESSVLSFAQWFKLMPMLAELGTAWLLFAAWRSRRQRAVGLAAFALYAWAPGAILIASYHGNTDALYFFFSLLAMHLLEARHAPLLAGLALAAALNVKLIPVVLVAPLATRCRSRGELLRYGVGVSLAAVPYAIAYFGYWAPLQREHFLSNVFGYKSQADFWGIEQIMHTLTDAFARSRPTLSASIRQLGNEYILQGGRVLLALSAVLALWQWLARRKLDAYALGALCYCMFLGFASGFGVQYIGCVLPPLLAWSLREGIKVGLTSGVFILLIYLNYVNNWQPIYSEHGLMPIVYGGFSAVAWLTIVIAGCRLLASAKAPDTAR